MRLNIDVPAIVGLFGDAVQNTVELILGLLPLGLTVFATIWGIKVAMRFFKQTAKG